MHPTDCPLCQPAAAGAVIATTPLLRVVWADEPLHPCFVRVVWQPHVAEMSDLSAAERNALMASVMAVERAMRQVLQPVKINLASFGNVVPHLHWHIIPRWTDDAHWPSPTWAAPPAGRTPAVHGAALKPQLAAAIVAALRGEALHG
jgi:diadenosine tetraphosphate (Ap4A) HIT family hydrolase